jgi:hypothetical protein
MPDARAIRMGRDVVRFPRNIPFYASLKYINIFHGLNTYKFIFLLLIIENRGVNDNLGNINV